jgi:hypothetical protein
MGAKEQSMIHLTDEQRQQLDSGQVVDVTDPQTAQRYVLLRKEVYERLHNLVYDDSDWTPEEQLRLLAQSGKAAGWDDPAMDVYDHYDENRNKQCP